MKSKKKIILISIILIVLVLTFYPGTKNTPIKYIDRASGEIKIEKVVGEKWLVWLYNNPVGKLSLHSIVKRKFVSSFYGEMMDSPKSIAKIQPFIKEYNINIDESEKQKFISFNDFFTRKLKAGARKIDADSNVIISPGDGKILAYSNVSNQNFIVKGYQFNLKKFLQSDSLAKKYLNGSIIILRVCPTDYHRFHFPVDGKISELTKIKGDYYSVSPIAVKKMIEIFCQNKREYVTIYTKKFGDVIMTEVGATMVGSIIQTYKGYKAVKGEDKGFFKFGGSSVVLLFEKNKIKIDEDLLRNTQNNLETEVKMGEKIGKSF
ncbi:MAG: phosphatidylserine decarboxylase [Bacteroidetes bacterium]|nr:MAG: phosphatidylserine decarboxylase [Bacteroidota bacterium]